MESTIGDPVLHVKVSDGNLEGRMGLYVDKNFNLCTHSFEKTASDTLKRFDANPRLYHEF